MTTKTYRRIDTEDQDGAPITFEGRVLGHASSKRDGTQPRWMEMTIFQTKAGAYVLEIVGETNRDGEVRKQRAHVFTDPSDVIEKLYGTDSDDRKYITYTARECLFQAMDEDTKLQDAWESRARVVA